LLARVAATGIRDRSLLEAMRRVPREGFVPAEQADRAYLDQPIPIPHGQVTTQPSLIARMVEALDLRGGERVLEIGSGHGFQAALLAELVAPAGSVWSVERFADLAEEARSNLDRHGTANAEVVVGDGSRGLPAHSPYEAIVVSAAFPQVPGPLADQLAEGGRLVQPLGSGGAEDVVLFEKRGERLRRLRSLTGARFVRLVGEAGFPDE
jgi:protein-L-isoaspartate(D-aspartate) O-methyltransferase